MNVYVYTHTQKENGFKHQEAAAWDYVKGYCFTGPSITKQSFWERQTTHFSNRKAQLKQTRMAMKNCQQQKAGWDWNTLG